MRLLRQGPFARLFAGSALNALGTWATLIALWGYAGAHFHVGPAGIALIGLTWAAPAALLSPFAGVPVDRFGPKGVLIAANVVGVASSLTMAGAGTFGVLVALALLAGSVEAVGAPAAMALPARLVDPSDLLTANAMIGAAEQSAIIFGPLVGSAAIAAGGIRSAFLIDAATFVIGAAAVASLRVPRIEFASRSNHDVGRPFRAARRDIRAGLALARRIDSVRRTLLLAVAVFMSWGAFFVLEPLYVRTVLHRSPALLGLFQTAFGTGLVLASLLLPRLGDRLVSVRSLAVTVGLSGLAAVTYVGTRSLPVAFVGVFAWGVDVAFFMAPMQTLLQRRTPADAHGRILALASAAQGAGSLVTIPLAGLAVGLIGVSGTGAVVGGAAVAAGIGAWWAAARRGRSLGPAAE
ncbi:MAG: MFS transporter, partial [Actinomycetota bacterium]|nr:MFS transporter [Actinomycetota bacterium]